jgi:hypothetical protein
LKCECNIWKLTEWIREIEREADQEDARTAGDATLVFFSFQTLEQVLERRGAGVAAQGVSWLDLIVLGHDYYDVWKHHHQAEEIIRMRLKECGDDW